MEKERVLSGIRPTGFLHLGNYFGALQNYVKMQDEYNCFFFVADWHALTTMQHTTDLQKSVPRVVAEYIACGLNPEKVCLYVQSDVPEIAELYLYLNMLAYKGELEKTATFKEKIRLQPNNINAGLLTYPVLQSADIIIHRATKVPVGKDQEQHLEMARNFAQRFNHRFGPTLPEPYAFNYGKELLKILSLDGVGKMSKSENQLNTIYLADEEAWIKTKIKKAKTDGGPTEPNSPKPDFIQNLFTLMQQVSHAQTIEKFEADYNQSYAGHVVIRYGDMKNQLAEDMANFIKPIREIAADLQKDKSTLGKILKEGKEKARHSASITIQMVREAVGVNYY